MSDAVHFKSSRMKIARARKHLSELRATIRSYIAKKPCFIVQEDAGGGLVDWTIRVRFRPPEDMAAVIGDVVHNLRASLDLLAFDLVDANGGNTKNVHFPFSNAADEFEGMLKKRGMLAADPADVEMLRSMRPYHGGNDALRAVHDMDIVDKHRTLIPLLQVTKLPEMRDNNDNVFNITTHMDDGQRIVKANKTPNLPLGYKVLSSPEFHFEYDAPIQGEIVPNLHELCSMVEGIVEAFAERRQAVDKAKPPTA